ncbi:hypothetical protein E2C01_089661 [Portunus trituberculatus]|uniref:Uncharacterized protein n=1 Tax=Portunus trituberculatus TaxID=210409 RepID=A0A5B7JCM8_PORTR|nr:hypothetical protein [Portunus trituberculatus]
MAEGPVRIANLSKLSSVTVKVGVAATVGFHVNRLLITHVSDSRLGGKLSTAAASKRCTLLPSQLSSPPTPTFRNSSFFENRKHTKRDTSMNHSSLL